MFPQYLGFPVNYPGGTPLLANFDRNMQNAPTTGEQPQKRGLLQRMGDRMFGPDISTDARRGLLGEALLAMAAGMAQTGGQGTAAAIGNGLQSGLLSMSNNRKDMLDRQQREQYYQRSLSDPAGLREFNELTRIASDPKEPEERRNAARVKLGLSGRASSAGFSQVKFRGRDGRERIGVLNGRTGRIDTPDGLSFDPSMVEITGEQPAGPDPSAYAAPADLYIDPNLPAEVQQQILAAEARGQQVPSQMVFNGPPTFTPAPAIPRRAPGGSAWVGRTPEEEAGAVAAATANATNAANLAYLPQELGMRTDAAVDQAARTAAAQAGVERDTAQETKRLDAMNTLDLLTEAEGLLPGATGSAVGRVRDIGAGAVGVATGGAQNTAALGTIAGQLIGKMPRFEGPQSDKDVALYRQMAGDLANPWLPVETRQAALRTIRSLNEKAARQTASRSGSGDADARRRALLDKY